MAERPRNLVCYETLKFDKEPYSLENYRKIGGYESWQKVLRGELTRDAIIWTHIAGDSVQRMKAVQGLL